jgi:hypothetical protein
MISDEAPPRFEVIGRTKSTVIATEQVSPIDFVRFPRLVARNDSVCVQRVVEKAAGCVKVRKPTSEAEGASNCVPEAAATTCPGSSTWEEIARLADSW